MLELLNVTKVFGERVALDRVSFEVHQHEVVGFVGRNGAGKTTTMRAIMGLLTPDDGAVHWDGLPINEVTRQRFGYMPEERGLYPKMKCGEQLAYFAQLAGMSKRDALPHASELLASLGLDGRQSELVEKLSLGNQQRVQLAAALVGSPTFLILDEPFSGLDPVGVDALSSLLFERIQRGVGMLFSSHQLELVERMADRVVIIDQGRILAVELVDRAHPGSLAERFRAILAEREPNGAAKL